MMMPASANGAGAADHSVAWQADAFAEGSFIVELDRFQGPLDLLLHLIRQQDIDIFDIPIARITSQFLQAIDGVERLGLDRAGEFLETAAMLVRIKAQMVLPRRADVEGVLDDPRAELVRRLLEYEHYSEAALRLEEAERARRRQFARGYVPPRAAPQPVVALEVTWDELFAAMLRVAERPREAEPHHVRARAVPIEEKIGLITQTLARTRRVAFSDLVTPFGDKLHGVVTLLAGLELAKRRLLGMRQDAPFEPLWLLRKKGPPPDATDTDH